jgi:predicted phosphoribosyltransferase
MVILQTPEVLSAIGAWYQHFEQLEDDAVTCLLARANHGDLAAKEERSGGAR